MAPETTHTTDTTDTNPAVRPDTVMTLAGEHVTDRLLRSQKLNSQVYLLGDAPPTPNQVGAVLHALADHTLITRMISDDVAQLGADRAHLGEDWALASGLGRFLQAMGDWAQQPSATDPE